MTLLNHTEPADFIEPLVKGDSTINKGDAALMFVCAALVQFMIPGLGFYYAGLIRSFNVIGIMMQSYASLSLILSLWFVCGFSLTFGEPWLGGFVGNPSTFAFFHNVPVYKPLVRDNEIFVKHIPGVLYAVYQGMFAVITPCLITGAFVARFRFGPFLIFMVLWQLLVYCPVGFWNWGGGWMAQAGVWDFAGGMVVHVTAGFAALATVLVLGDRKGVNVSKKARKELFTPHDLVLMSLGCAILWFGWFGFNGGSALQSGGLCAIAFFNTHLAASSALLTWASIDWCVEGKPTIFGSCAGVLAGLVAVTPCAGFIQPPWAFLIGVLASLTSWCCLWLEHVKLQIDDSTGVWAVHGMSGVLGSILTGAFADGPECADKENAPDWCIDPGTITSSFEQVWKQTWATALCAAYSLVMTAAIVKGLSFCMQLTADGDRDLDDFVEHGEIAYDHGPHGPKKFTENGEDEDEEDDEDTSLGSTARSKIGPTPRDIQLLVSTGGRPI